VPASPLITKKLQLTWRNRALLVMLRSWESSCGTLHSIAVKTLCGLLITVLLLHLQCGGSCLLDSFGTKANMTSTSSEPPCHQHSETPLKDQAPTHDGNSLCQGPITASKLSNGMKVTLVAAAVAPVAIETPALGSSGITRFLAVQPPHLSSPLNRLSVLRI
jgi:hypothetical protein